MMRKVKNKLVIEIDDLSPGSNNSPVKSEGRNEDQSSVEQQE